MEPIKHYILFLRAKLYSFYRSFAAFANKRPLLTFFSALGILLLLIVLSNFTRNKKPVQTTTPVIKKTVSVYRIGSAPRVWLQATTEKSGVVQITALSGGVVQKINFTEGKHVSRGSTLVSLSTNYQGGNILSVQRQIAQKQLQNLEDTFQEQKDLINRQRDLANTTNDNAKQIRDITAKSVDETQNLINLNSDILSTLDTNLSKLTASNPAGMNDQAILTTKQLKSQFQSANNQLNSALRTAQYQSSNDKPPAQLADIQKDITLKQLDIQDRALDLNREVTRLQLQVARINEALMYPAAPFSGTIQRVYIKEGQAVSPGTPLVLLSQDQTDDPIVAIVYAPREIAQHVSTLQPSTLHIGTFSYDTYPSFVTQDAIQGTLYGIYYPIPENYSRSVTDKGAIEVEVPVGYFDTSAAIPFVPLDAVYEGEEQASVFVAVDGKAKSKTIELGNIYGRFIEVKSGLQNGDQIILDRTVVDGDTITVQ